MSPEPPAYRAPHLQAWPDAPAGRWNTRFTNTALGPEWELVCQPWPQTAETWDRLVAGQGHRAWVLSAGVALGLGAGLLLRRSLRRRRAMAADRLASLMHSLKTPLALHKLRCDSLRMGRLAPAQAAEELLQLGEEVDVLTRLIERSLSRQQGGEAAQGQLQVLDQRWLASVAEDFVEAFASEGRRLELALAESTVRADEASLRSAVQTLLENALVHGAGTARLETSSGRASLVLRVSDHGPGLQRDELEAIGAPFQRFRAAGEEGFPRPGQGLGLSLLIQMAKQEGWGLELDSHPGQGLTATLEIPA